VYPGRQVHVELPKVLMHVAMGLHPPLFTAHSSISASSQGKRLRGFYHMSYANRLQLLHLDSLASRRIIADLVMCYKILNNHVCLDPAKFFTCSTVCCTRGNTMKLKKVHTLSARDGHFFSNHVVNAWNSLPDSVILSPSVASFKSKLQTLDLSSI